MVKIGIIGGSGLDDPDLLNEIIELNVDTPYGNPSSTIISGKIDSKEVYIISRHGKKHQFSPSEVNYKANIYALKEIGVTHIIATTACGSLKEEIKRGDFVIIDQFIDFTKSRKNTFFESFQQGINHTSMAKPFDNELREILYKTTKELNYTVHNSGTVVTIEGPRFSTIAESKMFQLLGGDLINMSIATEACLANEINIPYAVIAMSTDYDCWKQDEAPVTWDEILEVFNKNSIRVKNILINAIGKL